MKQQLLWFLIVGTIGFIVDAGITHILAKEIGFYPIIARVPAIAIAVIVTFLLNKIFTFKAGNQNWAKAFGAYITAQAASQAVNFMIYTLLIWSSAAMQNQPAIAVAIGSIAAMSLTFILSKFWVFKAR